MDEEPLPPNWIKRHSIKRNVPYYHNTLTKNSIWIHPLKLGLTTQTNAAAAATKEMHSSLKSLPLIVPPHPPSIFVPSHKKSLTSAANDSKSDGDRSKDSPRTGSKSKLPRPLHKIQSKSHEISRTPAQNRLKHLQMHLAAEQEEKKKKQNQTTTITTTTKKKNSPNAVEVFYQSAGAKSQINAIEKRIKQPVELKKESFRVEYKDIINTSPSSQSIKTTASHVRPIKRTTTSSTNQIENEFLPPPKRTKLEEEEETTVISGLFSFAKNVIRTVAGALSAETEPPETTTLPLTNEESTIRIPDSNAVTLSSLKPHVSPSSFEASKVESSPSPFRPTLTTSHTHFASNPENTSPSFANNRLAGLRKRLAEGLKQNQPPSEPMVDEPTDLLTDDEDSSHSNLTNDSDESMDWDECIEANTNNNIEATPINVEPIVVDKSGTTIVLDTNILINHLPLVRTLSEQHEHRTQYLMVPYVVLQELDFQKQRKITPVSSLAQNAIKYIHERLKTMDKRFYGQTSKANSSDKARLEISTNDDRILNCALQCQDHRDEVLLLTNDINLRNLALMNGLRAMSSDEVKRWLDEQQIVI